MKLKPRQQEAFKAVFAALDRGVNRHSENERSLSEFAKLVGYSKSAITEYIAAFTVADDFRVRMSELYETTRVRIKKLTSSLVAIHQSPRECWPGIVLLLLSKEWTVQDTRKKVKRANEFEIPIQWQMIFLPLPQIVYRSLDTDEFSPKTVIKLIEAVEAIESRRN